MITDIFARRYAKTVIRREYVENDRRFMNQAAVMIMDSLWTGRKLEKPSKETEQSLKEVHDALALELGWEFLSDRFWFNTQRWNGVEHQQSGVWSYPQICRNFLLKAPSDGAESDAWVKERLSLVELAFQRRLTQLQQADAALVRLARLEADPRRLGGALIPGALVDGTKAANAKANAAFDELVSDLNERLRLASYDLTFHNGLFQFTNDQTVSAQVAKPFWVLVGDSEWANVDAQMKEAIDRRDNGDRTAAFHAVCALESAIKIISDRKGWTRGGEKGAANYVDNLCSSKNFRYIEVWESEMLKSMFNDIRNPFAHGPGRGAMPKLSMEQTDWAIDTAMSWVKSLIRRFQL